MTEVAAQGRYARPFWRWYAAVLLMVLYTLATLDRHVVSIVVQPVKAEFQLTDGQLGLLTGFLFGIAHAVAGLFLGPLVDRVNRRNFLGGLLVVWSLATGLAGLAVSFPMLLASRAAVGAAESSSVPASLSMLANIFPPHRRSTATGFFYLSAPLGALLAAVGGGFIAGHWGWRAAFFAAGAPGLLLCLLMLATMPEPRRSDAVEAAAQGTSPQGNLLSSLMYILRRPPMMAHYLALVIFALAAGGKATFLFAFFMREHQMSIQTAGAVIGMIGAGGGVLGTVLGGLIADRLLRWRADMPQWWLAGVAAASGLADLAIVFAPSLPVALAAAAVAALIGTMWLGPGYGVATALAPERMRGKALTILQIGTNIATGTGALLVGVLSDLYGGPKALTYGLATVFGAFFIAGALFALAALRYREGVEPAPDAKAEVEAAGAEAGGAAV